MDKFKLKAKFRPAGDQPKAIDQLVKGIKRGDRHQVLLGVTGSGKTFTMANVIAKINRPTLVIAHNKTLAAQLCQEYRSFFPDSAVEYFVSYYDYYQPEAYLPHTDTYIEKEAEINTEIERLRHATTQALLTRRDVIVVASVSCIYNLGSPKSYQEDLLVLTPGQKLERQEILRALTKMQFQRNQLELRHGTFRVRGETLEIMPAHEEKVIRVVFRGDKIEEITSGAPFSAKRTKLPYALIYPARHYSMSRQDLENPLQAIEAELKERLAYFKKQGKLLEADRLSRRTKYDLEMIREVGYCTGIENYSRYFDGRSQGEPPWTLLDYFPARNATPASHALQGNAGWHSVAGGPKDYLLIIDESHISVPQIEGMYHGDKSRKETLVEYGFRLPSAKDNRPLRFHEFWSRVGQVVYTSATPADFELKKASRVVEQIIRPTGLVDPKIAIRGASNQVEDLIQEIKKHTQKKERVLVTTLTKKMAEDLTEYLGSQNIRIRYLHSEVETLRRIEILRDLRRGDFDVLVGVNLLREGLDLPEVSLVAILDADKEGFLRSQTALIQTIGRAARNICGQVILYADEMTGSIRRAVAETERRRKRQVAYNQKHKITPQSIKKAITAITDQLQVRDQKSVKIDLGAIRQEDIEKIIANKQKEMKEAARNLEFELAAILRDEIIELVRLQKEKKKIKEILG